MALDSSQRASASGKENLMSMIKRMLMVAVLAAGVMLGGSLTSEAKDLPLTAFFGNYKGTGLARNDDTDYFVLTIRDLDVTIQPAGAGFKIDWTTVIREGGTADKPKMKRRSESISFKPAASRPGLYIAEGSGTPPEGRALWAHIAEQTLTISSLVVLEDGDFELHRYDRTLTDLGMELDFLSFHQNGLARRVTGKLVKNSN
jgi:hypothetical protein